MTNQISELQHAIDEINTFDSDKIEIALMLCKALQDIANEVIDFLEAKCKEKGFEWLESVKMQLVETVFANDMLVPPPEAYFFKLIDADEYFSKAKVYFKDPDADFGMSFSSDGVSDLDSAIVSPRKDENPELKVGFAQDTGPLNERKSNQPRTTGKNNNQWEDTRNKRKSEEPNAKRIERPPKENVLYQPIQCKTCGLRFSSNCGDTFVAHIEEHRRIQRAIEETTLSREYFLPKKDEKKKIVIPTITPEVNKIVCSGNDNTCAVCSEKLDVVWDEDVEDWIYKDAIEVDGDFCHRGCVE